MFFHYPDDAMVILAECIMRERRAEPKLLRLPRSRPPRRPATNVAAIEAELDHARARATQHIRA